MQVQNDGAMVNDPLRETISCLVWAPAVSTQQTTIDSTNQKVYIRDIKRYLVQRHPLQKGLRTKYQKMSSSKDTHHTRFEPLTKENFGSWFVNLSKNLRIRRYYSNYNNYTTRQHNRSLFQLASVQAETSAFKSKSKPYSTDQYTFLRDNIIARHSNQSVPKQRPVHPNQSLNRTQRINQKQIGNPER